MFKSRLSSDAGRDDDKRTGSAVREDAKTPTQDHSRGLNFAGPETVTRLPWQQCEIINRAEHAGQILRTANSSADTGLRPSGREAEGLAHLLHGVFGIRRLWQRRLQDRDGETSPTTGSKSTKTRGTSRTSPRSESPSAASQRKPDFPLAGMKGNPSGSTCAGCHCLQRDVGGRQVSGMKWEGKSEETEVVTTVLPPPPPLMPAGCDGCSD